MAGEQGGRADSQEAKVSAEVAVGQREGPVTEAGSLYRFPFGLDKMRRPYTYIGVLSQISPPLLFEVFLKGWAEGGTGHF